MMIRDSGLLFWATKRRRDRETVWNLCECDSSLSGAYLKSSWHPQYERRNFSSDFYYIQRAHEAHVDIFPCFFRRTIVWRADFSASWT